MVAPFEWARQSTVGALSTWRTGRLRRYVKTPYKGAFVALHLVCDVSLLERGEIILSDLGVLERA